MNDRVHLPTLIAGLFFIGVGVIFLLDQLDVWDPDARYVWPAALVVLGVALLVGSRAPEGD